MDDFIERRKIRLLDLKVNKEHLMSKIDEIEKKITDPFFYQEIDFLKDKVNNEVFKIVIVGHFSAGKSTFLNAFLGRKLLPSSASETTAASTRIFSVSEDSTLANKAEILFRNGSKKVIDISEDEKAIEKYVSLLKSEIDIAREIEYVDVYLTNSNQQTSICFVDTPGANGLAKEIFETTKKEIRDASAIVYLLPNRGFADPDRHLLDYISNFQDRLFFALNQLDLIAEDERAEMLNHVAKQAEDLVGKKNPVVYGISSKLTLEGRQKNKEDLAGQWGFTELESALTTYMMGADFVQGFYDSIQRQIHLLDQEVEQSLEEDRNELEKKQRRAGRHIQFIRKRFLTLENTLVSFIDEQTEKLQLTIENNANAWIEPAVQTSSGYLSNEIKALNKRLKQLSADQIIQSIQKEFKALDQKIQSNVSNVIQQFHKKTEDFLDIVTDNFQQRNHEITELILQFENEDQEEMPHITQLNENLLKRTFSFQSISTGAFSNQVHSLQTVSQKRIVMEAELPKIKGKVKQTDDEIDTIRKDEEREFQRHKEVSQKMGVMPDVDEWDEEYDEKRGGLFGWLGMTKTKTRKRRDDSKQKNWRKQKEDLENRYKDAQNKLRQKNQELTQLRLSLTKTERETSRQIMEYEMEQEKILSDLLDKVLNTSKSYTRQLELELREYLKEYVSAIHAACYEDIMGDRDEIVEWIRYAIRTQQKEIEDKVMELAVLN
jgi:GTPase SAR1 family protein